MRYLLCACLACGLLLTGCQERHDPVKPTVFAPALPVS